MRRRDEQRRAAPPPRPAAPQATSCRTRSRRSQRAASAASAIATVAKAPLNFVPVATPASADARANRTPARALVRPDGGGDARRHPEGQRDVGDREVAVPDVERHDREERRAEERRRPRRGDPPQQEVEHGHRRRPEQGADAPVREDEPRLPDARPEDPQEAPDQHAGLVEEPSVEVVRPDPGSASSSAPRSPAPCSRPGSGRSVPAGPSRGRRSAGPARPGA